MALLRRQARTSSIESSDAVSSSDEEILPTKKELTLQDDDKAIEFQSVLPEDFGSFDFLNLKTKSTDFSSFDKHFRGTWRIRQ